MFDRFREIKPRARPESCGHCGSGLLTPHCANPACPWSQCPACKHTTGTVLGETSTTDGIALRQPGK